MPGAWCGSLLQGKRPDTAAHACSAYERGLGYVGSDWAAHALWEKYGAYCGAQGEPVQAAAVYRRALGRPLKELDRVYAT